MKKLGCHPYYTVKPKLSLWQNLSVVLGFLPLILSSNAVAETLAPQYPLQTSNKIYLGIFGGGGYFNNNDISQTGTVFFNALQGGTLAVVAKGNLDNYSAAIFGAHVGYEGMGLLNTGSTTWNLIPAVEIEGYFFSNKQRGQLLNPTPRIPQHTFNDSFQMRTGVFLLNALLSLETPSMGRIHPYIGAGAGIAVTSLSSANSLQTNPPEAGVNHFNSNTNDSSSTFAAQAKAGLRFNVTERWRILTEYRLLYLAPTNYTFGATQYPNHAATTTWDTHFGRTYSNMGILGVEYSFC